MNKATIKKYSEFRKNSKFKCEPIEKVDSKILFRGQVVEDEIKKYSDGDTFLNMGYGFKNNLSHVLSNLYPLQFKFKNKKVSCIESVLQGIKHKDKKTQNLVLKYSGYDAYHTRAANTSDLWSNSGILYWQGKPIVRDSEEYQIFLDELYLSAAQNPIYAKSLLATNNLYLLHHFGKEDVNETVLTRFEYEIRVNTLREFLKIKK